VAHFLFVSRTSSGFKDRALFPHIFAFRIFLVVSKQAVFLLPRLRDWTHIRPPWVLIMPSLDQPPPGSPMVFFLPFHPLTAMARFSASHDRVPFSWLSRALSFNPFFVVEILRPPLAASALTAPVPHPPLIVFMPY